MKDAEDFLREKFGHFNSHHPLNILGYAKGLEPDIEDIINIMEMYADTKTKELQKEIDDKNKEICDLLDWGNGKDAELDKLEKKITEIQNDYMQVQTNQQLAKFKKEELK